VTLGKVVIVRRGALIKDFPEKKTATVTYPVISGLKDPAVLKRVKLQSELRKILADLGASKSDQEDVRIAKEAGEVLESKTDNLDDFSVGARGITFLYDAGYPHVIQAFEPEGRYFFSYAELKCHIKRDGILGQFVD
jgi:hypothetical protein